MHLLPLYMYIAERTSNHMFMEKLNIMDCIECGACTYNCPGRLHLTHSFRTGKAKIQARNAAAKARAEAEKKKAEAEKAEKEAAAAKEAK